MRIYVTRESGLPLLPKKYEEYLDNWKKTWDTKFAIMNKHVEKLPKKPKLGFFQKLRIKNQKKMVDLQEIAAAKAKKAEFKKFQAAMETYKKQLNKQFANDFEVRMEHTDIAEILTLYPGVAKIGLAKDKKSLLLVVNG